MSFNTEVIWVVISFILTLVVFSFLLGDIPFFRFVSAVLIGMTAGYMTIVIIYQVLIARLAVPLLQGSRVALIPLLLSGMLLMKLSPRLSRLGNPSMALLVGVGAAVAVGGAVLGTLFGQVKGALVFVDLARAQKGPTSLLLLVEGIFFLLGTQATLFYFHFSARKVKGKEPQAHWSIRLLSSVGRVFIAITLGAVFAGVITAGLTALVERADFLLGTLLFWVR